MQYCIAQFRHPGWISRNDNTASIRQAGREEMAQQACSDVHDRSRGIGRDLAGSSHIPEVVSTPPDENRSTFSEPGH